MKILALVKLRAADAKEMSRQGELAFTMVEIAIAIGVIGFALVAIIGILPTGMNVQKDNREDTVISQDAPYFLDAIRNGAPVTNYNGNNVLAASAEGLDFLTNYVQSIRFDYYKNGVINSSYTRSNFLSGVEIIGLLSTPQTNYANIYPPNAFSSNFFDVTATVRALSGPATGQQSVNLVKSGMVPSMAFTYNMEVMITPFNSFAPSTTNWNIPNLDPYESNLCYNRWVEATPGALATNQPITVPATALPPYPGYNAGQPISAGSGAMQYNLFDVRLHFSWPVLQNGNVGPGRQTYRTLIAAPLYESSANGVIGYFFQPLVYANVPPPGL